MKAHEVIIQLLEAAGVETVFGLMSEDTLEFMAEIEENWRGDIRLIHTRHEQGAMAMADGYSRTGSEIGVCVVGRGPAIAQTGTSLITARKNGSRLLVLVPETPLSSDYDIKEFEQESYLRTTVENVISTRSHETLVPDFTEALRQIRIGNGPVAVQIPWDVLDSEMSVRDDVGTEAIATETTGVPDPRLHPAETRIEEAVSAYLDSDSSNPPVILVGRGAMQANAKEAIEDLAERTSALLATTLQARGYFSGHPFYLGFVGGWGSDVANEHLKDSDFVFVVGCSLNPYTTDDGRLIDEQTTVVQIDADPATIERYQPVDIGILGDARATVTSLLRELERRGVNREGELWTDTLRARIAETPPLDGGDFPDQPDRVDPRDVVETLDRILPDDRVVVTDAGHFTRWVLDGIRTDPDDLLFSLDFAAVGQGLPMGIGATLAAERRACLTVCGDAGFMMSLPELETATRNEIPVTVVVMNDQALGSEYHNLVGANHSPDVALIDTPDLAAVAQALGADGYTVRSVSELDAIGEELAKKAAGPVVVDCKVNHEVRHRSKR